MIMTWWFIHHPCHSCCCCCCCCCSKFLPSHHYVVFFRCASCGSLHHFTHLPGSLGPRTSRAWSKESLPHGKRNIRYMFHWKCDQNLTTLKKKNTHLRVDAPQINSKGKIIFQCPTIKFQGRFGDSFGGGYCSNPQTTTKIQLQKITRKPAATIEQRLETSQGLARLSCWWSSHGWVAQASFPCNKHAESTTPEDVYTP